MSPFGPPQFLPSLFQPTRQAPTCGRVVHVYSPTQWSGSLPGTVIRLVTTNIPTSFPHGQIAINLWLVSDGESGFPEGLHIFKFIPLYDPLVGKIPADNQGQPCLIWAEWPPYPQRKTDAEKAAEIARARLIAEERFNMSLQEAFGGEQISE